MSDEATADAGEGGVHTAPLKNSVFILRRRQPLHMPQSFSPVGKAAKADSRNRCGMKGAA